MKTTIVTIKCDLCRKEIRKDIDYYKHITGYAPIDAVGVVLVGSGFGGYVNDICQNCYEDAILEASEKIKNKRCIL